MVSGNSKVTPFGRKYYYLTKDVLLMSTSAVLWLLGEYMRLKRKFQLVGDSRREGEATAMMDVCRKELVKRGCFDVG